MNEVPELHTERLLLKPLCLADAPTVQAEFPQWEVVRYLSHLIPWPYPEDGALSFIRDVALPRMAAGSAWLWSIRMKRSPEEFLGLISLDDAPDQNRGFWLIPKYRRRGMASEACEAVTEFWFKNLGRPRLRVPKAVENLASRRISQASGMRVIDTQFRDYVGGRLLSELWEITAEEWDARRNRVRSPR